MNFRKGIIYTVVCRLIWGFMPLYWALGPSDDTPLLMMVRALFGLLFCFAALLFMGKLPELKAALKDRNTLLREGAASLFLLVDWVVYLWGVLCGHAVDCSLGYLIQPIVVFSFSALIFHEKFTKKQLMNLAVVLAGVALTASSGASAAYITVTLAFAYAVYAAIKKGISLHPIISTTLEVGFMMPVALAYAFYRYSAGSMPGLTPGLLLFYIGAGAITVVPVIAYSVALQNLPFQVVGMCQYFSPVLTFICGLILGEKVSGLKLIGVVIIAVGVVLYVIMNPIRQKQEK